MESSRPYGADATAAPLSVTALVRATRDLLEARLPLVWVAGEISNFTRAASGHCYFSLKDENAQVRCVLFRQRAQLLDFLPGNGMLVEVRAQPTLYEARGEFQLQADFLRRAGLGALFAALEKLKERLAREGLFEASRKRALPRFPRTVGVVTSLAAAALRDVLTTLARRMPGIAVVVYPTPVQGAAATREIVQALERAGRRRECDVLILCRGGGSIEDLWCFNEEPVIRALAACPVPVVSGVGHETDVTLADFVADARAPTPTAAAEMVSPDAAELRLRLAGQVRRLARAWARVIDARHQRLDGISRGLVHPGERLQARARALDSLQLRLRMAWTGTAQEQSHRILRLGQALRTGLPDTGRRVQRLDALAHGLRRAGATAAMARKQQLGSLEGRLQALNPLGVLERGYALVQGPEGELLRSAGEAPAGATITVRFAHDALGAVVSGPAAIP